MSKSRTATNAIVIVAFALLALLFGQRTVKAANPKPLQADEILALTAGNALPQNIVHFISQDGLAFHPDDAFRAQLTALGADASIVSAINAASIAPDAVSLDQAQHEVLQHYVNAAQKIKSKDYQGAYDELIAVAKSSIRDAGAGFVMGDVLRAEENFDGAAAVYLAVLKEDPEFPEVHTKLAFIAYKSDDGDEAVKEANLALSLYSDDAEAHKNEGLGLLLLKKFDAAEKELNESLRLNPGYPAVIDDLGIVYAFEGKYELAIEEYKKAIPALPLDPEIPNNIGLAYDREGNISSAMVAYRQAIQVDPKFIDAHANLGHDLQKSGLYKEAVSEYRAIEQLAPNSPICHDCFGTALFLTWDFDGAEKEFHTAMSLDPTDFRPHLGLGSIREDQKRYVEALAEYQTAEQLNPDSVDAPRGIGRIELLKKDYADAATALKHAEDEGPADAGVHDLYAQTLLGEGKNAEAIQEFKESLSLDSTQIQVALRLASALEKDGQWPAALDEYRKTAAAEASVDYRNRPATDSNAQSEYQAAQTRFNNHIAALKSAGKSSEAAALEASVKNAAGTSSLSDQLNALMQAGMQAGFQRNFQQAKKDFQDAVNIAQQLQPHDQRLVTALDYLGQESMGQDFAGADAAFEQELKVVAEIYGPQSGNMEQPLQSLGTSALLQKNYDAAGKFYFRAVDIDSKIYGESSDRVAASLIVATRVFMAQQQYDKAEPYLLRAERLDESLYGADSPNVMMPLWTLCDMYDKWGKPDKAEPCYAHALGIGEIEFGDNNPQIVPILTADAGELRKLGKTADADKLEKRAASLESATMSPN